MKFDISKSWAAFAADIEKGVNVAAGNPTHFSDNAQPLSPPPENRIAFSLFLSLARRKQHLSVEALANKTDVDAEDLLAIERDPHAPIEPRIVYQLSRFFGVPNGPLMRLAGLAVERGSPLVDGAVHAAAHSASMASLTREERVILDQLIGVLTAHKSET
jgi:hypothetical protein